MASAHKARKRFGQNFLTDQNIIQKIIRSIHPQSADNLVEIGPGQGALTAPLLSSCQTLTAIEIDRDLIQILLQKFQQTALNVVEADALSYDFAQLITSPNQLRIVGNLPYNISTPLLFHLLKFVSGIKDMHFVLQKEVIERICAQPNNKAYGRLSVMIQCYCEVENCFLVLPEAFNPKPKVTSAIIRLKPKNFKHSIEQQNFFSNIVKLSFSQRRKTLKNNLKTNFATQIAGIDDIDFSLRPEQLSVADYVYLAAQLSPIKD